MKKWIGTRLLDERTLLHITLYKVTENSQTLVRTS